MIIIASICIVKLPSCNWRFSRSTDTSSLEIENAWAANPRIAQNNASDNRFYSFEMDQPNT